MRVVTLLGNMVLPDDINKIETSQLRTYLTIAKQSLILFKDMADDEAKRLITEATRKNPEFGKLLSEFLISMTINKPPRSKKHGMPIQGALTECLLDFINDEKIDSYISKSGCIAETGASHYDYWKHHFSPIASVADSLIIFDKYAGSQLVKYDKRSGLHNLITYAITDGIQKFQIVTENFDNEIKDSEKILRRRLEMYSKPFPIKIDLNFQKGKFPHDRHMRFEIANKSVAYALGKGTEVFRGSTFGETFTITEILVEEAFSRESQTR